MERILVLVHDSGPHRATMEFACYLANLTRSKLTGLIMHPEFAQPSLILNGCHSHREVNIEKFPDPSRLKHLADVKLSFENFCYNHQVACKPETIDVKSKEDIYLQTRFADLLIITADVEVVSEEEHLPSEFSTDILKHAECPVFIAPLTCKNISKIVFTYDGSASSVFAIRQFTHLFPQLSDLPVTFLEVNRQYTEEVNHKQSVLEYLNSHYKYIDKLILKGNPEDELFSYFLDKKDMVVIMGAFGRKFFSSIFHRSTATLLLQTTSLPIFISHQ
jgi:nucleotide-binding universal stress UspA family protein